MARIKVSPAPTPERVEVLPPQARPKRKRSVKQQKAALINFGLRKPSKTVESATQDLDSTGTPEGTKIMKTKSSKRVRPGNLSRSKSNPLPKDGGFNLTKILLIAGGGALLYDYISGGKLLGLFGNGGGILSSMFGTGPVASHIGVAPGGSSPQASAPSPTTTTSNASNVSGESAKSYADYLASITNKSGAVQVGSTVAGGDTARDLAKFNTDTRAQTSFLVRGSQGQPYSVAILRLAGKRFNLDQWNWYRSQQGGTAIDLDAKGLAPRRGVEVDIDGFLSVAGPDPIETAGLAGLSNPTGNAPGNWDWLM